jgi:L-threonylcarbamoyladenylate synthase
VTAPVLPVSPEALDQAAAVIRTGGLVAIPTETVYGLAADAANGEAVARIYAAKGRPRFNPLICHVSSLEMARRIGVFSPLALRLAEAFWPGPLSLIAPRAADAPVSALASAGLPTIAVRMPDHEAALDLIRRVDRPLAAPSANLSEQLSPTTAQHVAAQLSDRLDLILDGGPCRSGVESTIIAVDGDRLVQLRPGAIARADIAGVAEQQVMSPEEGAIRAPGMMQRHYAPRAQLRLDASDVREGELFLAFGDPPRGVAPTLNLSTRGDLIEAASNLFAMLHELDARGTHIAIAPLPDEGIGEAICDRLKRAAARSAEVGV